MKVSKSTVFDRGPEIHDMIRKHIAKNGMHYGYNLDDFDNVVASFQTEGPKEDFLQELYDALPTD